MIGRHVIAAGVRLVLVAVLVAVASCTKHDSLVLLELRTSGPLRAPVVSIRLSASGWPTRTLPGSIGPAGFLVGYYGPGDGKPVTVKAEALDAADCVLGVGSAGVPALDAGATSASTTVFVRPLPGSSCAFDFDAGGIDAGGTDTGGSDAGTDPTADAGDDAAPGTDATDDVGTDATD